MKRKIPIDGDRSLDDTYRFERILFIDKGQLSKSRNERTKYYNPRASYF